MLFMSIYEYQVINMECVRQIKSAPFQRYRALFCVVQLRFVSQLVARFYLGLNPDISQKLTGTVPTYYAFQAKMTHSKDQHHTQARQQNIMKNQCFVFSSISMRIRIQQFRSMRIRIQIQDFDDKKLQKNLQLKKIYSFYYKKLQFTYPQASIKDVQAKGEAFKPLKENIQHKT